MKRTAFTIVIATLVLVLARPVEAKVGVGGGGHTVTAIAELASADSGARPNGGGGSGSKGGTGQPTPPQPTLILPTGPNGTSCTSGPRAPGWTNAWVFFAPVSVWQSLPSCSGGAAAPPPSPIDAANQVWYWETKLPAPTLATSPPNGAITGLDTYLAISGPQTKTYDVTALGYNVHLDVTSVYDVDWGDPKPDNSDHGQAVTKNHPTQGGLYPVGDLRHMYINRGTATINVTQRWIANWSAGGQTGTIADRLSTTTTLTIPIQEIQAVITG